MTFSLSQRSKDRMIGVDSRIIEIINLAITITKIDFGIPKDGGLRTSDRQKELFDKGLSQADGTINKSYHQTGKAIDIYSYFNGNASWNKSQLTFAATAILQAASILGYNLQWGGLWSSNKDDGEIQYGWDMAHFQLGD